MRAVLILALLNQNAQPIEPEEEIVEEEEPLPMELPTSYFASNFEEVEYVIHELFNYSLNFRFNKTRQYGDFFFVKAGMPLFVFNKETGDLVYILKTRGEFCGFDFEIVGNDIFITCGADKDQYDYKHPGDFNSPREYEIRQIDLITGEEKNVWGKEDGISNTLNMDLIAHNGYLWIDSFEGVSRIDLKKEKVDFFDNEVLEGFPNVNVDLHADDEGGLWGRIGANIKTTGGAIRWNEDRKWLGFIPNVRLPKYGRRNKT